MAVLNILYIYYRNNIVTIISKPIFVFFITILRLLNYFILGFFFNDIDCIIPMFNYIIVVKNKHF